MRNDPQFSSITGQGIGIALIDTGVYAQNPDLKSNVKAFFDATEQPVNAPIDPNFLNDAIDHNGHGSHTAGIAASSNPAIGVAYQAGIISIRGGDEAFIPNSLGDPIFNGLQWIADHATQFNIKVVNMSLGPPDNVNAVPQADQYATEIQQLESMGITVVTSDGNSYQDFAAAGECSLAAESTIAAANTWPDNGIGTSNFSAFYGDGNPYVAVENSAAPDQFNATSQRSSLSNQLVAPGSGIFSTWNSPTQLHNTETGTSMSAPFISGVVALMQQAAQKFGGRYLDPLTVLQLLRNSADQISDPTLPTSINGRRIINPDGTIGPVEPLPGTGFTYDRVNVYKAMQAVKQFMQSGGAGADNNNTFATAISTTPLNGANSVTVTGNVGTDGQVIVGGKDVDLYKLTLLTPSQITISGTTPPGGVAGPTALRLFDSSGGVVLSGAGANGVSYPFLQSLSGQPVPAGTYYLGVSSTGNEAYNPANGTGAVNVTSSSDYQITVSSQTPDPGGIPGGAKTLSLATPSSQPPPTLHGTVPFTHVKDVIGAATLENGTTINFPNGDIRFYKVVAPDTGNLIVETVTNSLNPFSTAQVYDQNFNLIGTAGHNITVPVAIGQTYYIGVTTTTNTTTSPNDPFSRVAGSTRFFIPVDIYVGFDNGDANGTAKTATPQTIGTAISGTIGSDNGAALLGANGGNKDVDFYQFTAPTAGVFKATVSGAAGFTPEMSLWSSSGSTDTASAQKLIDANTSDFTVYQQVTAGQILLLAVTGKGNQTFNGLSLGSGSGGQTGSYGITTSVQPLSALATLSNNSIGTATPTPITLNQTVPGNIGVDGSLVVGPTDVDLYSFTAPATREYQFSTATTQEGSADTFIRVFDGSGNQIAYNDNANPNTTASSVNVAMHAGQTYYIGVNGAGAGALSYNPLTGTGAAAGSTGPYSLTAADVGPFQRTVNLQSGHKTTYIDSHGNKIVVTLTGPGAGQLIFNSDTNTDLGQLVISGTDNTSTVTIRGASPVGGISVTGSLGSLSAPLNTLTGDMSVTGGLRSLRLSGASGGHTISIGGGSLLSANLGQVSDFGFSSAEPVRSIRASQWTTTGTTRYSISASSIESINVPGTFNEDVSADTIDHISAGTLQSAAIRATTSIASIFAGAAADSLIFAGVPTVTTMPSAPSDFSGASLIKSVRVRGSFSNTQIAAWNVGDVVLGQIVPANGGKPFGIAADRVQLVRAVVDGKPQVFKNLFAPLTPVSLGGDAIIRLIG